MSEGANECKGSIQAQRSGRSKSPNPLSSISVPVPESERIPLLKKQRGAVKCRLTLFEKYFNKLLEGGRLSSEQTVELQLRYIALTELFKEYNSIQVEIENIVDECDLLPHLEYREQFESSYYHVLAATKQLLRDENKDIGPQTFSNNPVSIKLPEIKLPIFDGSYDRWLEFRNSYKTMIHSRNDLDSIQKFHYLKSSLSGSALQVISALEFTAPNYFIAWDLLENRFHNNRLLVQNHVKSLFTIPSITRESPTQIRKLIDTILRNLRALNSLNEPTNYWDTLIIYLIVSKLDCSTEREWETHKGNFNVSRDNDNSLKLDDLISFLKNRADMLEMIQNSNHKPSNLPIKSSQDYLRGSDNKKHLNKSFSYVVSKGFNNNQRQNKNPMRNCLLCNDNHYLYTCPKFLTLSVLDRLKFVRDKSICTNCLRTGGHTAESCTFSHCKICQIKHNTLLHVDNSVGNSDTSDTGPQVASFTTKNNTSNVTRTSHALASKTSIATEFKPVLLSTALIEIADANYNFQTARALLDSGSQHSIITERLCNRLNITRIQSTIRVCGVGQMISHSNDSCKINIRSKTCSFNTHLQCLVLPTITSSLPSIKFNCNYLQIPNDIKLADPTFNIPADIDILLGADMFWELLNDNKIKLKNGPILQDTKVGWIISGPIYNMRYTNSQVQCNTVSIIDSQLKKFWELEEITNRSNVISSEDEICEKIFTDTTVRDEHGRFHVRMPLRKPANVLGDSYTRARNSFFSLENKLERSPQYKKLYIDFMKEYEELGHMSLWTGDINNMKTPYYFLPHHGVYRESSLTTQLRVVFNASATTTSNYSLNDIQYVGPILQNDVFSVLLRFRQYRYVVCADIQKMYRNIGIHLDQRDLQLIVWRSSRNDALRIYKLNTVTYGTASAPYLSIRCLHQLASECNNKRVAQVITDDMYVDDVLTGDDQLDNLLDICNKTSEVLRSGCFLLRKWTFNYDVDLDIIKQLGGDELCQSKTLGLGWSNKNDEFSYTTKLENCHSKITKRLMLSVISQIYDPLGLLAPAIIQAKILLQNLWLCKLDWNDPVPANISQTWNNFVSKLEYLPNIRIPRHVLIENATIKELHIFSDASQNAYGACAYIRSFVNNNSLPNVRLLCAKSKVAPIKPISIPRLELCGALLGAKLYDKIKNSLRLTFDKIYFWTDSTIVLSWIRMSPHLLKTFVQNRVTQINELTGDMVWRHVKGALNPSDMLTRGVDLNSLQYDKNSLWWCGPPFLSDPYNSNWSCTDYNEYDQITCFDIPDLKVSTVNLCNVNYSNEFIDFERFSSFNRLKRMGAYLLRFIYNTRVDKSKRKTGSLSVDEINESLQMLTRIVQQQSFPDEYHNLKLNLPIKIKNNKKVNKIAGLNIFLDKNSIMRIGGRLGNAEFNYDKKHPILLCSKHRFAWLLFTSEHKRLLHAGPQLLVSTTRDSWWTLGARNLAKKVTHNCVTCVRMKGKTLTPVMGNLPPERLEAGFVFMNCGVDFAGPIYVLNKKGRGARLIKNYICLFICFSTRAIHLELVGGLSTQDYILALKRFISRRGKPHQIFSDNGKNFVGAERELLRNIFQNSNDIIDFASNNNIKFTFIPPYAPHFGGLWEAGVKSCKYHLRRIVGNARLTYEELSTVLTQIEAVLNSRPMYPMSADPDDFQALTPGHFLIGRPLTALIYDDLTVTPYTRLARYDRVEQLRQHFWQRWSKEYVSELQKRTKWFDNKSHISLNKLVIVKDDHQPPLNWKLGKIIGLYPGKDGVPRVADIRTASGVIRRALTKICPLPISSEHEETRSSCKSI